MAPLSKFGRCSVIGHVKPADKYCPRRPQGRDKKALLFSILIRKELKYARGLQFWLRQVEAS